MAWGELAVVLRRSGVSPDRPPWAGLADDPLTPSEREAVLRAIIADLDERGNATAVIRALSAEKHSESRRLALEIVARMPSLDSILIAWLRPVLRDRRMPAFALIEGTAALLRTASNNPGAEAQILRDFAAGYGRKRVLKRRKNLRARLGASRTFDLLCADLKRTIPLRCPHCGVRRRPMALERHLWRRHHRLLVDGRARSPLRWFDQLRSRPTADRDTDAALDIVSRHITRRKLKSTDADAARLAIAARRRAAVCPHCSAIVGRSPDALLQMDSIRPLAVSFDRLTGEGWVVERQSRGIGTVVRIQSPDGAETSYTNSPRRWSQRAAIRRLVLPWVILALGLAVALPAAWAILGTAIALSGAYAWRIVVRAFAEARTPEPLINAAWARIASASRKRMEIPWRFVVRLAITSGNFRSPTIRRPTLRAIIDDPAFEAASGMDRAALLTLLSHDLSVMGDDPLPPLLDAISHVWIHDRPMSEIESLVERVSWREWAAGRKARWRVALIERAFAAGLGVWELIELGRVIPGFGNWIAANDLDGLARLRCLWLLRSERSWESCGPAATAFELAAYSVHEDTFAASPSLLLEAPLPLTREPAWLHGGGLSFRGASIHRPELIEVHLRPMGGGYELHFGSRRFHFRDDPSELARSLNAWSRYHFEMLLARSDSALGLPDGSVLARLIQSKTLVCPECNGMFRESATTNDGQPS